MTSYLSYLFLKKHQRTRLFTRCSIIILFFTYLIPNAGHTQGQNDYDEISVTLSVPRIGSWEMPAIIKGQSAYLPVKELFDILQIKNSTSATLDSIKGFFINPKANYLFDKTNDRIVYVDKIFNLKPTDLIHSENNLYLKSEYFGQIFGLECIFNFRSLSITINTKLELPAIREMQLEQMRRNITQLKGDKKADTTIKRKFSIFNLGMADWSLINFKQSQGLNYTRITTNLGAVVAGGEATMYLNYTSGQPFDIKQQYYRWRYVDNDHSVFKQVTAGNIFVQSTASVYGAITGVQITNTPTTYRRSFGTYRLTDKTDPEWMVELYVNNVLVNYTKADASGFFTFDVPLVYGNTVVKLRFYGPWGEERTREQNISIPFNFLPVKQFEYSLSAGIIDDDQKSRFSRLNLNYGLGSRITVGGGVEYLSSVLTGKSMPFVNTSLRIGSNLLISAEHTYGVRSKAVISYHLPSSLQLEVNYTKYVPGQTAIRSGKSIGNNYIEDKKAVLFMPYRTKKFSGFSRLSISQLTVPHLKYTTAELLLSGMVSGINANLTTSAIYSNPAYPLVYSNLAIAFRLPKGIRITPQAQYEYKEKKFSMVKCELEKNLWNKGFMILGYEKNLSYKTNNISVGIRYNFSFAQTSFSISQNNHVTSSIESARGSLLYNDRSNNLKFTNQSNVGRGGLVVAPFLDFNCNGRRDPGEPKAQGLKLRINGGRLEHNKKDTTIIISGLEAYTNYYLDMDKNSFDNIGWQLRKSTMNVIIDPNHFKLIEVPVAVVGEISGTVFFQDNKGMNGLGRLIVNFYDESSVLVGRTITESDGYFSFVGLAPGKYIAQIDSAQLHKLNMSSFPIKLPVTIKLNRDGDIIDGLKLILKANNKISEN
ncbi:MAG: Sporulation Domain-Containing Protein [Chitinophagaceae bacterium]|nr:Sporulation Domain-Containing Protein [Chitinophagaceae bacterium]